MCVGVVDKYEVVGSKRVKMLHMTHTTYQFKESSRYSHLRVQMTYQIQVIDLWLYCKV